VVVALVLVGDRGVRNFAVMGSVRFGSVFLST
jgi:hypothetical protein